jgi:hypothetical protein
MGADLCLAFLPYSKGSFTKRNFQKLRRMAKGPFRDGELLAFANSIGLDSSDPDWVTISKRMLSVIDEVEDIRGRRDTADCCMGGQAFVLTGGMSWGDAPSDAFQPMVDFGFLPFRMLKECGFLETPIEERFLQEHKDMPASLRRSLREYLERKKMLEAV